MAGGIFINAPCHLGISIQKYFNIDSDKGEQTIMSLNIEVGTNIRYTDETGTYYLFEGDKVICHVGEKVYNGTISCIGIYKEEPDSEPQQVIYMDTFKSRTSMSRDMIKLNDITGICKNPFSHDRESVSGEQKFVDMFMERGYSRERAKTVYDRMSDAVIFYNIPVVKAAAYAMQAIRYVSDKRIHGDKNSRARQLAEFAKECADMAAGEYFKMFEMYINAMLQGGNDALVCLEDTLDIVSKCWNDLSRQKTDETVNVCGN